MTISPKNRRSKFGDSSFGRGFLSKFIFLVILVVFVCNMIIYFHAVHYHDIHNNNNQRSMELSPYQELISFGQSSSWGILQEDRYPQRQSSPPQLDKLYAFTIRDSKRPPPHQPPIGMHIFDYVDVYKENSQHMSTNQKLYLDGYLVGKNEGEIPCHNYTGECYHQKIIQTFTAALEASNNVPYLFYMESDNELCIPLMDIQTLAVRENRYFIGTGIGASGWIMSKQFVQDLLSSDYGQSPNIKPHGPDIYVAQMFLKSRRWSVTRQYLVSHTLHTLEGKDGLTVKASSKPYTDEHGNYIVPVEKHLPRCLEPHRGMWLRTSRKEQIQRDKYGWDYFDYVKCPNSSIFPCGENQIPIWRDIRNQIK